MTEKHFQALADLLGEEDAKESLVSRIADFCAEQNPNFDRELFLVAVETKRSERPK